MRLRADPPLHLTYCTNIHPADGWAATNDTLRRVAPELKRRLSPQAPFGLGLRLGARDARELRQGDRLAELKAFLDAEGLYVALINGFPYGPFHGEPVKTRVYAPDWRAEPRVDYTLDLVEILAALLPESMDGGISTTPLSYKAWMPAPAQEEWQELTHNVLRVAERLIQVKQETGRSIHLDIEPEPDCLLETTDEAVAFFQNWLWRLGGPWIGSGLGLRAADALDALRDHVRACFDCCHCAVEYEDPIEAIAKLRAAGVGIGRVQLSSALEVDFSGDRRQSEERATRLRAFAESTYLHQVVEQHGRDMRRFPDLQVALDESKAPAEGQWRIHFHVPLFTAEYDGFRSSQDVVRAVLGDVMRTGVTSHLEIETYTWNVLPAGLKLDLTESIEREYRWVLDALA